MYESKHVNGDVYGSEDKKSTKGHFHLLGIFYFCVCG